jgi:hypothetical protein
MLRSRYRIQSGNFLVLFPRQQPGCLSNLLAEMRFANGVDFEWLSPLITPLPPRFYPAGEAAYKALENRCETAKEALQDRATISS